MMYSREIIDEVKLHSDIVQIISQYVTLQQKGKLFFGLCPFHDDSTPSFAVNRDEQFYYCYGCGSGGDVFQFLSQAGNYNFVDALQYLAQQNNILLPEPDHSPEAIALAGLKERLFEIHRESGLFYFNLLQSDVGKNTREYLQERGLSPSICKKFGLGYSSDAKHSLFKHLKEKKFTESDMLESGLILKSQKNGNYFDRFQNRLMFPIFDSNGKTVGFGGRILEGEGAKYINSPETTLFSKSKHLYALNFARKSRAKELILVEGYMDVISLFQGGFKNVVASLGTAFNKQHVVNLKKFTNNVILLYDSDNAGTNATLKAIPILVENGLSVKVLQVKDGKDPDQFIKEHGREEFIKLLGQAVHYVSFQIACSKNNYDLEKPEEKIAFAKDVAKILSDLDSEIERSVYLKEVQHLTDIEESAISSEIDKLLIIKNEEDISKNANKNRNYGSKIGMNKITGSESGLLEAQRSLLYFCSYKKDLFILISQFLKIEEFTLDIYKKSYTFLQELYKTQEKVQSNELIGYFVGDENQKYIAKIFAEQLPTNNKEDLQKSLTEMIKLLKITNIDKKIDKICSTAQQIDDELAEKKSKGINIENELSSTEILNKLLKAKKELEIFNISL